MRRWIDFQDRPAAVHSRRLHGHRGRALCGGLFERPFEPSWRNDVALFMGLGCRIFWPSMSKHLTEVEIRSHRLMAQHLEVYRTHAPGFETAFLLLSAPQIGVRHARRLVGVDSVTREDWASGVARPDEVGVSPSLSPKFPNVSVPYGCLVPRSLDGLLVAGRAVSCDATSHSFLREIPQCWLTGQAAGTAAALAVAQRVTPRNVSIERLQAELARHGGLVRAATPVAAE